MLKLAGNTGMMLLGMVIFLFTVSGGTLWYPGGMIQANAGRNQEAERESGEAEREDMAGVRYHEGSNWPFSGVARGDEKPKPTGRWKTGNRMPVRLVQGVTEH
ncbi:mobilization protein (plasmid) [Escherichia coli]